MATSQLLPGGTYRIPTEQIDAGPNARGEVGNVSELAVSLAALGQQVPLIVEQRGPNRYRIIDGHRRHRAATLAGLPFVDAVVRKGLGAAERMVKQLAMHAQARSFEPIAEARALHSLMFEHSLSREQISRMVGKGPDWVRDRIALLRLSEEEQRAVAAREMPVAAALGVVRERRAARDGRPVPAPRSAPRRRAAAEKHCPSCTCAGGAA